VEITHKNPLKLNLLIRTEFSQPSKIPNKFKHFVSEIEAEIPGIKKAPAV